MKKNLFLFLIITAPDIAHAACKVETNMAVTGKNCPNDVASFVERSFGCEHAAGTPAWNDDVAADIDKQMIELQCYSLRSDLEKLQSKYVNNQKLIEFIRGNMASNIDYTNTPQ
jgi:hypothetical protein